MKTISQANIRKLLAKDKLSLTEAAKQTGVSKQYLSQFLSEPPSKSDDLLYDLCMLLELSPGRLFSENPSPFLPQAVPQQQTLPPPLPESSNPVAHFTDLYHKSHHLQIVSDYNKHCNSHKLTPKERAELQLVVGKAMVNTYYLDQGSKILNIALKLFQQRQSHNPQEFLPKIIDCYRYLALAAYLKGEKEKALKLHQKLLSKAQDLVPYLENHHNYKVHTSFLNGVTLAKQLGNVTIAKSLRSMAKEFYTKLEDTHGLDQIKAEQALSQAKAGFPVNTAYSPGDQGLKTKITCYLALNQMDLNFHIPDPKDQEPRLKYFLQYVATLMGIFRNASSQQALKMLQHTYYGGGILETDYFMIAHCLGEQANKNNQPMSALNHFLDALRCTHLAGQIEEYHRLLVRIKELDLIHSPRGKEVLQSKISSSYNWLKEYWEETND